MTVTTNIYQKQIKYILFTVPATWQCVDHKNVVVPEALWWIEQSEELNDNMIERLHREFELEIERV
jgi:hypothetical protein